MRDCIRVINNIEGVAVEYFAAALFCLSVIMESRLIVNRNHYVVAFLISTTLYLVKEETGIQIRSKGSEQIVRQLVRADL